MSLDHYVSVIDTEGAEIILLTSMSGLDATSRKAISEELARHDLVKLIERIDRIQERRGQSEWHVMTQDGHCCLTFSNFREAVRRIGPDTYLLEDVAGKRYKILPEQLDIKSKSRIFGKL